MWICGFKCGSARQAGDKKARPPEKLSDPPRNFCYHTSLEIENQQSKPFVGGLNRLGLQINYQPLRQVRTLLHGRTEAKVRI